MHVDSDVLKTVALLFDSARRLVRGAACLKTMEKIDKGKDKKHTGKLTQAFQKIKQV